MEQDTTKDQAGEKKRGFLVRLLSGEVSLAITYWLFSVLIGNVALRILLKIVELNSLQIASWPAGDWLVLGFYLVTVVYGVAILIATWRSAGRYQGRKIWAWLARITVVLGALALLSGFLVGLWQGSNGDRVLENEIAMMNRSLPGMIDDDTRLDHVALQSGDLYYNYTLVNWLVADLDVARFVSIMTAKLKTAQCLNDETRPLLDQGRKFVYIYRDKSSKPVADIVVEGSDCL